MLESAIFTISDEQIHNVCYSIFASTINIDMRAFVSNCTPHATEAFSPIDHQSRGLCGPSYRGSSAGVSGCLSMFHTIVIGWSPVASHFNRTTSLLRAVSLRNLLSKRGGTETENDNAINRTKRELIG